VLIADALFLFCFVFDRLLRLSLYSEVGDLSAKFVTYERDVESTGIGKKLRPAVLFVPFYPRFSVQCSS